MGLLLEETISQEPTIIESRKTHSGASNDDNDLKNAVKDFCAIFILRAGDSMLGEIQKVIPGLSIGNFSIQRDKSTADKRHVF